MTKNPIANATSTSSKAQRPELATKTRAQDPIEQPRTEIESSTHLCITIRWRARVVARGPVKITSVDLEVGWSAC
jgi:hypothetical protein